MANKIENTCKVNPEKVPLETEQGILESEERKWGMALKEVYKHGLSFFKDKEGKAMHLSYEDRLKLVAYTQQIAHGSLDINSAPPLGVLDVIGRDRRAAWQALGQMSQYQAMAGFVHTLDRLCPLFKPYLEAIQKDSEDKKQQELKKLEEERAHLELQNRIILEKQKQQSTKLTEEQQVQRIKDALNAQTYDQFLQYAQQQFPGNFDQQAVLIRQLQDQHYQQYIQQLAVDKRLANSNIKIKEDGDKEYEISTEKTVDDCNNLNEPDTIELTDNKLLQTSDKTQTLEYNEESKGEEESEEDGFPAVEEARMWTRGDIGQFKESARAGGGRLTVGQGETVTVRVPTHRRARCLCWEFATDNYDIGFGLYFEWSKSPTSEVTVHVSESDEEDDVDDDGYGDEEFTIQENTTDPEAGGERRIIRHSRPLVSLVVPIYRRDCHTEVYAGSHTYPGEVLCTSPNKFTVIDPEGVIAPQSCIDIVVRYTQPSVAHCNTTEKFRITMYDRNTQQALGKRDIPTKLIEGEPLNTIQESLGDSFHPLTTKGTSIRPPEELTRISCNHPLHHREQQPINVVAVAVSICCIAALLLPTQPEKITPSQLPDWLHIGSNLKLVFSFVLGLVSMLVLRP